MSGKFVRTGVVASLEWDMLYGACSKYSCQLGSKSLPQHVGTDERSEDRGFGGSAPKNNRSPPHPRGNRALLSLTYQDPLGVADAPGKVSDTTVCRNNGRGKVDGKHAADGVDDAAGILVVTIDRGAEGFVGRRGCDVRVPVQAVEHQRQQRLLDGLLVRGGGGGRGAHRR